LKTKIKNKLKWLRVGVVLNWESLVLLLLFVYFNQSLSTFMSIHSMPYLCHEFLNCELLQ